ncbi:MAG TPA: DUF503 domain-containing protein [Longimicrobiales bacterium]|nr:DUF503 domain-containing protein [Longimicrobiales bacterium]
MASLTWELTLPGCSSLKEKRSVIRSLRDRLRAKFNVSVAETAYQDVHTRAQLSIALVATDARFADSVLEKADNLVGLNGRAIVTGTRRELY